MSPGQQWGPLEVSLGLTQHNSHQGTLPGFLGNVWFEGDRDTLLVVFSRSTSATK